MDEKRKIEERAQSLFKKWKGEFLKMHSQNVQQSLIVQNQQIRDAYGNWEKVYLRRRRKLKFIATRFFSKTYTGNDQKWRVVLYRQNQCCGGLEAVERAVCETENDALKLNELLQERIRNLNINSLLMEMTENGGGVSQWKEIILNTLRLGPVSDRTFQQDGYEGGDLKRIQSAVKDLLKRKVIREIPGDGTVKLFDLEKAQTSQEHLGYFDGNEGAHNRVELLDGAFRSKWLECYPALPAVFDDGSIMWVCGVSHFIHEEKGALNGFPALLAVELKTRYHRMQYLYERKSCKLDSRIDPLSPDAPADC